jgi:murein DD-endopeptidase MepM/ murein hydrolase activator NlpD
MHLERYFVASGEQVRAGQTIALVGRTGVKRSPPHLHFEVRLGNKFEDPWTLYTDSMIPPVDTLTYRYAQRAQRARARAARSNRIPTATINVSPKF